jgi:hypothetical protein
VRNVFTIPDDLEQLARLDAYPGVSMEETRPLREFFRRHALENFTEVRFNVRVGAGESAGDEPDQAKRRAIEQGTRLRMDAVGFRAPDVATLIEAKAQLANDGVWQLLGYRDAYVSDHPTENVRLVLVAEGASTTALSLARNYGIAVFLYEWPAGTIDVLAPAVSERADGV